MMEPIYCGAYHPASNICTFCPGREYMTLNFTMEQRHIDMVSRIEPLVAEIEARALSDFKRERFDDPPDLLRSIDFRYSGQNWELEVSVPSGEITPAVIAAARTRYDAEHDRQFGLSFAESPFELVNFRVVALARHAELHLPDVPTGPLADPTKSQKVHFAESGGNLDTPFYLRSGLTAGSEIPGPALIIEDDATTLVPPRWTAHVEPHGSIILGRN